MVEGAPRYRSRKTGESFDSYEQAARAGFDALDDASGEDRDAAPTAEAPTAATAEASQSPEQEFVRISRDDRPDLTNSFEFYVVDESADPANSIVEPRTGKRLRRATREENRARIERQASKLGGNTRPFNVTQEEVDAAARSDAPAAPARSERASRRDPTDRRDSAESRRSIEAAPSSPEEVEVLKALLKFNKLYVYGGTEPELRRSTEAALRAALTDSVSNIWPTLRDRIQDEIKNPPASAILDDLWNRFDKASLNLRVPAAAEPTPRATRAISDDWQREREGRINSAVNHFKERYLRDGVPLAEAYLEAREMIRDNDEFTFRGQLRGIRDIDKRQMEKFLKTLDDQNRETTVSGERADKNLLRDIDEDIKKMKT